MKTAEDYIDKFNDEYSGTSLPKDEKKRLIELVEEYAKQLTSSEWIKIKEGDDFPIRNKLLYFVYNGEVYKGSFYSYILHDYFEGRNEKDETTTIEFNKASHYKYWEFPEPPKQAL